MFIPFRHILNAYLVVAAIFAGSIASIHNDLVIKEGHGEHPSIIGYVFLGLSWPITGSILLLNSVSGFPMSSNKGKD